MSTRDIDIILAGVCCSITNLIFILGIMSSSGLCVSCNKLLIPPDANFCAKCGAPQTRPQLCIHCKAQLPGNSPYCSKCGEPQSHSKQQEPSVKWCRYCRAQLPPDTIYCTKCSKPQMTSSQEPVKSTSCILCKRSLKGTPQNCNFCSAPQDPHEFSKRSFKECDQCGRRIFKESKVCIYQNCSAFQKTPPSTPVHEEVGQFFPQNPPTNATNVTQSHDHSSHPLQLPQDSPDMSLQPTDKPAITKEQMLQKFKSPSPSASPSPLTTEHDGGSTDHRPDSASTSLAKRVSGSQKRSSDDEDETNDAAKRAKITNEATRVSGAVTSEKVENTYGIVGETNDNGGSSVPRKRKPSDHDYDSLETPSSKKPETLGSTEAHDEDWVMLNREEIQHYMENEQGNKPEDKKEKEIESQGNNEDNTKGKVKPNNNDTAAPKQPEESYIAEASDSESESSSSNTSHKKSSSSSSSHSNSTPGTPALNRSSNGARNASPKNDAKSVDVHKPSIEESSSTYKPADADGEKNGINGSLGGSGKDLGEKDREGDGTKNEANGKGVAEDSGKGGASGKAEGGDGKVRGGDGKAEGGDGKAEGGDGKAEGGDGKVRGDGKAEGSDGKAEGGDGKVRGDGKAEGGDGKAEGGDGKEGGDGEADGGDEKTDKGGVKADGGDGKTDRGDGKGGASGKGTDGGKLDNEKNEVNADDATNSGTSGNVTGENGKKVETAGKSAGGDKGKNRASVKGDDGKGAVGGSGKGGKGADGGNVKSAAGEGGGKGGASEKGGKGTSGKGDDEKSGKGGGKGKGKGKKDESNEKGSGQGGKDKGSGKSGENSKGETSSVGEESKSQNEKKIQLLVPNL